MCQWYGDPFRNWECALLEPENMLKSLHIGVMRDRGAENSLTLVQNASRCQEDLLMEEGMGCRTVWKTEENQ